MLAFLNYHAPVDGEFLYMHMGEIHYTVRLCHAIFMK